MSLLKNFQVAKTNRVKKGVFCKIIKLLPKVVDKEGLVHEQYVVLKLLNGKEMLAFDPSLLIQEFHFNKRVLIEIYIEWPKVVKKTKHIKKDVIPEKNNSNKFYGQIKKILLGRGKKQVSLVVDIGMNGTIFVDLNRSMSYDAFEIDDYVEITDGRTDLYKVVKVFNDKKRVGKK